jgi:NADH-quinone oxidoreductase subunit C
MDRDYAYEVVYHLYSFKHNRRLRLKARLGPEERIASVTSVWSTADWHEREAYDLVGIVFEGHPDLRRILMPEDYDQHPLRRDFPLNG